MDVAFDCTSDAPPLLPESDDYVVAFHHGETKVMWGQKKLFLHFTIVSPPTCAGQLLFMVCTVPKNQKLSPSSKLWRAWVLAIGKRPPRKDRFTTKVFRDRYFLARVITVRKDSNQRTRTAAEQYSIIDCLLERCAGADAQ